MISIRARLSWPAALLHDYVDVVNVPRFPEIGDSLLTDRVGFTQDEVVARAEERGIDRDALECLRQTELELFKVLPVKRLKRLISIRAKAPNRILRKRGARREVHR